MQKITERIHSKVNPAAFEIRWAEFELSGRFLRGGISNISDLSTQIVTNTQRDFGINLLARRAARSEISAGTLEWVPQYDLFLWFLPYRFYNEQGKPGVRLRGLVVSDDLFGEIIDLFNGQAQLTAAEKRTLYQLVAGIELRQAAELDHVGYETKRAQTKGACEKLQCSGQKDLVRKAMGQLFHLMSVSDADLKQTSVAAVMADKFLSGDMDLVVCRHESGGKLRYFVGGPEDGKPVILVHGMMFPVILKGVAKFLERHRLRLHVPIRSGYLETGTLSGLFETDGLIETGLRDIEQIVERECRAPVTLIGNSLGGPVAIQLALESPHLFSHLILQSVNLARPAEREAVQKGGFYQGMQDIKSDRYLFKLVNLEYRKFYSNSGTCQHILKTHFAKSKIDLMVLDGVYCGTPAYEMFAMTYASSVTGIAEDFRHVMSEDPPDCSRLQLPLSVIHGSSDPMTPMSEIMALLPGDGSVRNHVIEAAGHFAAASHGDEVWEIIARTAA